jgi:hypothetical protein
LGVDSAAFFVPKVLEVQHANNRSVVLPFDRGCAVRCCRHLSEHDRACRTGGPVLSDLRGSVRLTVGHAVTTSQTVIWHGTGDEGSVLNDAVARNCTCTFGPMGMRQALCPLHETILHDQRFLNGLVYVRRRLAIHQPAASQRVFLSSKVDA